MLGKPKNQFTCIHCGSKTSSLYKKYSETVLKLCNCTNCNKIADKYVEYDILVIIIDLILLQKSAYRHLLFNADLKNFWKLSILLVLLETYSTFRWDEHSSWESSQERSLKPNLTDSNLLLEDFAFYQLCLVEILKTLSVVVVFHGLTWCFKKSTKEDTTSVWMAWKTVTVSSTGIFLILPSLIWDKNVRDLHVQFVSLYTTLSQLIAYTVFCNCPKIWSLIVVFTAFYCKTCILYVFQQK